MAKRILTFPHRCMANLDDPRSIGEALKDPGLGELRSYRAGDYRVIARLEDAILVVRI